MSKYLFCRYFRLPLVTVELIAVIGVHGRVLDVESGSGSSNLITQILVLIFNKIVEHHIFI